LRPQCILAKEELMRSLATRTAAILVLMFALVPARAGEPETRDLAIYVDGKKSGESHVTIQTQDDGSTIVSSSAEVNINRVIVHYSYSFSGTETWKDGKLTRLDTKTNDDGKKLTVSAVAQKDVLKLKANNNEREVRGDVWSTTYARYPDVNLCNKNVPLLDVDTGKELVAKLEFVGAEEMAVAGRKTACNHFRLRGDVTIDLWYDGQKRLVRQESVEQGHKVLTELTAIRK
jgi:hypothetical protein